MSFDSVADNRAFAEKFSFGYPLLSDIDRQIALAFGAADSADQKTARRVAYVIDREGRIALAVPKVDTKAFAEQMLAHIRATGA